ncbi:hypothetical protein OBBRIDRAFT_840360 [Obba rivulosa]|uniref:Uncharacterized protein n=1 Tax=Obba rivulosa TaxID=1052685 RepID=A0A8E2AFP0_9APHY|nr:hypothetical protein OBBRIDRAFT_840360 [Obba rivulosa]
MAHLDFSLTHLHNAPRIMFLSKCLCLWHLAHKPLLECLHKHLLLLDDTIKVFRSDID